MNLLFIQSFHEQILHMSRQLRTLLKHNRRLEEKIFYEPRKTDWRKDLISAKELSVALTRLANKIAESTSDELSVLTMLNEVDFITGRPLASYEKNALQVVEILFNYLRVNTDFEPRFYKIFNSLQLAFTRLALDDLSFLDNQKHPAVTFLEKLVNIGHHFDKNAGKLAEFLIHAIELLISRLASKNRVSIKIFAQAHQRLDEYLNGFEEKSVFNRNKLVQDIQKKSRKIEADFYTTHLIKSKIEGDEIPIFLLDFFENQLSKVLYKIILKYGAQSKQCQQLLTDMDTITWSISCAFGDPDYGTRFEADVPQTMKRVYGNFDELKLVNEYMKAFFFEVEELHRKKLDGQRVHLDVMISADIFSDEDFDNGEYDSWSPAKKDIFDIQSLLEDHWYYLNIEDQKVRCKLLMINQLSEKLYFINLSGELLVTINFDEKEYLAENLEPFINEDVIYYKYAIMSLTRELTSKIEVLEKEYENFKQQQIIDEKQQQQLEKKARLAVLKRLEKEKKEVEKRRLEVLEEKRKAHDKIIAEEKAEAERRFRTKGILKQLGPGSVVAIMLKPDRWAEASLMLISRTTQRYIFSDSGGNKVIEPTKAELIVLIEEQKLKIVKADISQLDPLQALVVRRREKLAQRM